MKFEMIIFDLDGTLWETEKITYKCANAVLRKYNINQEITMNVIRDSMGSTFEECAKNYMPNIEKSERERIFEVMLNLNAKILEEFGGNVYKNLKETLEKLKNKYKLAIVSNCADGYIESFLSSSNLEEYFDDYMAAAKFKVSKAEAITEVIKRNNITNAIYVGDTLKDFEATKIANIDFIQAKYGFGENLQTKYSIDDIVELPELLDRIQN